MPPRSGLINVITDEVSTSSAAMWSATNTSASSYYGADEYHRIPDWGTHLLKQDVDRLTLQVDNLSADYADAIRIALDRIGLADYKSQVEKEVKSVIESRLQQITETVDKAYKSLNEKINVFEKQMNEKLEKFDAEFRKRKVELDKIDFLAKELGYQMEIADKSF